MDQANANSNNSATDAPTDNLNMDNVEDLDVFVKELMDNMVCTCGVLCTYRVLGITESLCQDLPLLDLLLFSLASSLNSQSIQ